MWCSIPHDDRSTANPDLPSRLNIGSGSARKSLMPSPARKLIFIAGSSHSGSTVLDMLLTTRGKAVGLGQIWTVLSENPTKARERVCSCGAAAMECALWRPVIDQLQHLPKTATPRDRYRLVLQ